MNSVKEEKKLQKIKRDCKEEKGNDKRSKENMEIGEKEMTKTEKQN